MTGGNETLRDICPFLGLISMVSYCFGETVGKNTNSHLWKFSESQWFGEMMIIHKCDEPGLLPLKCLHPPLLNAAFCYGAGSPDFQQIAMVS